MNDDQQSPDDSLEDTRPDTPPTTVGQTRLPEDNDRPAAPADDPGFPPLPMDDPRTDNQSNIDSTEEYQEGTGGAVSDQGKQDEQA